MPDSETEPQFFAAFLDDYFAECDEHLTSIRRALLALDGGVGRAVPERGLLDELLRNFHTIKGLSGMVGLREAEQLAHLLESGLRTLSLQAVPLTPDGLEALIEGTRAVEHVIAARRESSPPPDTAALQVLLSSLAPDSIPPASVGRAAPAPDPSLPAGTGAAQAREAHAGGMPVWRFAFRPTRVLAERGVNVNSVRERLQQVGKLLRATPRVLDDGGIAFDFLVATRASPAAFAGWAEDGLIGTGCEPLPPDGPEPRQESALARTPGRAC